MTIRPRRSVLYMPGANERALEKAKTLPADSLILDLEDSVAPEGKAAARANVCSAVKGGGYGRRELVIRVNAIETAWGMDDLRAAAAVEPDAILVPKVSSPDELERIGARLLSTHTDHRVRIWAMIETPTAIFDVRAIAAAAKDSETRLGGFVLGLNDLAKETRARQVAGRAPMVGWIATCLLAARENGIDILDGVYNDIGNAEGFARECIEARDMGFDGKTLVHPNQIAPCNAAFSPSAEEVAEARKIIAVFDLPANKDKGVVELDGRMVERMHADIARRTVAIADAISKQD